MISTTETSKLCFKHVHERCYATAPTNALRRAVVRGKFSKGCPYKSSAARENPVFWDADYAGRFFLRHVTPLAIVIGHRATPKKRGAVKDTFFTALRNVATVMINSTVYLF